MILPAPRPPRVFGLLPFRGLDDPKSRLGGELPVAERRRLALDLLRRAVGAMLEGGVAELAIVTLNERLGDELRDPRARVLFQRRGGLNAAIRQGQRWAIEGEADALLILLPDLPLVEAADVVALLAAAGPHTAVIAPDRHGTGTNALLLAPPDTIMPAFGEHSAHRHRLALALADVPLTDIQRPGTHLDLDTPDDLRRYYAALRVGAME
ncbi:MAG TPA: 2-phospho-L-lactate guanylyltransferase [Thermomicrobiales bacterium]|nr:2-phospho-L-lactate guanylyltransferase [Thermomicrobiales bacterium]